MDNSALEQEIKQLKEQNERLVHALNIAADGIYDWQITQNGLYLSPGWYESLGFDKDEIPPTIEQWQSLLHPDDVAPTWSALKSHINGENEFYEHQNRLRMKNGEYRWNLDRGKVVERDEHGVAIRMVGVDKDISKQKQSEDLNQQLAAQLFQAKKMEAIGAFAGGIAHEFNNILGIAFGLIELLSLKLNKTDDAQGLSKHCEQLVSVLDRGRLLVEQIVAFSRKQDETREHICLNKICGEVVTALTISKRFSAALHFTPPLEDFILLGDSTHIHQLLTNLCINADLACQSQGRIQVSIESEQISAEHIPADFMAEAGLFAKIRVMDNGIGMSPQVQQRIFEPFFTTRGHGEGTGMGLAIVHGVVNRYQGFIKLHSEQNKGSCFDIYLPLHELTQPVSLNADISSDRAVFANDVEGEPVILFVDDETVMLDVVRATLPIFGLRVEAFSNASEAIRAFSQEPQKYQMLVTDQAMPQTTGLELIASLRKVDSALPVLLYTGLNDFEQELQQAHKVQSSLLKPLRINELVGEIRRVLKNAGRG